MQNRQRQGFGPGRRIPRSTTLLFLLFTAVFTAMIFPETTNAQMTGVVSFTSTSYQALTSQSNASIGIVFTGTTDTVATVDFVTADGTAQAGVAYVAVSNTFSFAGSG